MSLAISHAVGRGPNANLVPLDVAKIQALLSAYFLPTNRNIAVVAAWVPGVYHSSLGDMIQTFQHDKQLAHQDGRVDPNGTTWRKLNELFPNLPPPSLGSVEMFTKKMDISGYRGTVLDPPQLSSPTAMDHDWDLQFGGVPGRSVNAWYYETAPGTTVRYIGVCCPQGVRDPDAYLLYFHHHAKREPGFYQTDVDFLNFGIGDYMLGRMQCIRQLARSFKNVAIVVAAPVIGGNSEFIYDEAFVRSLLLRIDSDILGIPSSGFAPLIVAGYSSGSEDMQVFLKNCPGLRSSVRAIYDFDGAWIGNFDAGQMNALSQAGAQVIRYVGGACLEPSRNESTAAYINRHLGKHPSVVPLPLSRWKAHREFQFSRFAQPVGWWMHAHIPSCMLMHALTHTEFLR